MKNQRTQKLWSGTNAFFMVGDFAFNLIWQGTAMFLMYFYTDVVGISPTTAGLIYMAVMLYDGIADAVFASIADRTNTRWGRFRPYIFFGALPLGISYFIMFSHPPSEFISVAAWAALTQGLMRTAYTVAAVPYTSLPARLTSSAEERTVLTGFRTVGASLGAACVFFMTPALMEYYGPERELEAFSVSAACVGVTVFVLLFACGVYIREPAEACQEPSKTRITDDLRSIVPMFFKNPPLMRVFGIIITTSICVSMYGKNVVYFFKYVVQRPDLTTWALAMPMVLNMISVPFWVWYAGKTSKRQALLTGASIGFIGFIGFFFLADRSLTAAFVTIVLIGLGWASLIVMYWAMLPDTVEYGEFMTGVRAEAKIVGFATFAQKSAVGINALLMGLMLDFVHFRPNAEQKASALFGIKAIMSLFPAFGMVVIIILTWGYILDREKHDEIVRMLAKEKNEKE
jgi:GPH family glycoside/pentoside/hexuronide:cation symporter